MKMEFDGKVAIVTGATSGIGMTTARKFVEQGGKVAAAGRKKEVLSKIAGPNVKTYAVDLLNERDTAAFVQKVCEDFGGIDVLVNAAGIIANGTIENTSLADYDLMMNINVRSLFQLTQLALPSIIERKGNIVNVSSVTGLRAFPNVLAYCVSKAAVDQLTRCAALDLAPRGVRVNAVNPGVVVTNLHRRSGMDETKYASFLERSTTTHPLGRTGTPEEIADLIAFLVSPSSAWMTGDTIGIDGGRHLTCLR
jgi:NAD(P)-dependent dehydrogenase (short-subunit alcohol dehydrogenase family)